MMEERGMELQKKLAKHLRVLNRTIRRLVARDKAFEGLRALLRKEHVELAIYVVPLIGGKPAGAELRYELTDEDRKFLKKAGLTFEQGESAASS